MSTPAPPLLTTVNSQVFLQMVFIFEGLATLSAFELAIACSLGQHLVLGFKKTTELNKYIYKYTHMDFIEGKS